MVVGSQARILYADAEGRMKIAEAFNNAIANRRNSAPVILGRDHHDVSGTDSPYRETSNIYDGLNLLLIWQFKMLLEIVLEELLGFHSQWRWRWLGRSYKWWIWHAY